MADTRKIKGDKGMKENKEVVSSKTIRFGTTDGFKYLIAANIDVLDDTDKDFLNAVNNLIVEYTNAKYGEE